MLDKHVDKFKYYFLVTFLLIVFYTIGLALAKEPIISDILTNDPFFLVFRLLITVQLVSVFVFSKKWR